MKLECILKTISPHFLNLSKRGLIYGPQGKLLLKNFEEHWFSHCVTMPRYNVFLSDTIGDTWQFLQHNSMDEIPFAFASVTTSRNTWNDSLLSLGYKVSSQRIAKISMITDTLESKNLLHKKQRERKVWWRRLAQCPSRFVLTEAKKIKNQDTMEIEAQFPFGNITVETITHYPAIRKLYSQVYSFLTIKYKFVKLQNNKRELIKSHIYLQTEYSKDLNVQMIEHVTSLDWSCLALLCDSHISDDESTTPYIHPKLSPYKTTFNIIKEENETDTDVEDLNHFVVYLNDMLRTKGIHTIMTNSEQVIEMCLVPYVVSVNKTSLKNGIVYVKSRATTLKEAVHITDLLKYITLRSS